MSETVGIIGKKGKLEDDLYTRTEFPELIGGTQEFVNRDASWGITHYVRLLTEGKSWQQICDYLNENQFWENRNPPNTNQNYKHRP
jgi:hypothetical protein